MTYSVNDKVVAFTRSFDGDAKWLEKTLPINLANIRNLWSYVVTGIPSECEEIQKICDKNGVEFIPDEASAGIKNGYINQQYTKLMADVLVPAAEWILHIDSDTFATGDADMYEFVNWDGKPIIMMTPWPKVGDAICWQKPTWDAVGVIPKYEFMRRLPWMYPAWLHRKTRSHITNLHGQSLLQYLSKVNRFSEYNVMGAYAYEYHRGEFDFLHTEKHDLPKTSFLQCWSHGSVDQVDKQERE